MRSMLVKQLHGLMGEFGMALPVGWNVMPERAGGVLADDERCPIPVLLRPSLHDQIQQIRALGEQIQAIERQIATWQRRDEQCQRHTWRWAAHSNCCYSNRWRSTVFRSGREFAAFLGLVPRQSGTGGRVKLLGISKRGDGNLRTLLIHGARAVLASQRRSKGRIRGLKDCLPGASRTLRSLLSLIRWHA